MSTPRRLKLPLLPTLDASPMPTLERARRQLGGAGVTSTFAGTVLRVHGRDGSAYVGVALFASGDEVDIWLDGSRVRRARMSEDERTMTVPDRRAGPPPTPRPARPP